MKLRMKRNVEIRGVRLAKGQIVRVPGEVDKDAADILIREDLADVLESKPVNIETQE